MMNCTLFPHGGSGNHGCEAIVRTTVDMLEAYQCTLFSDAIEEDKLYELNKIVNISSSTKLLRRFSCSYLKALVKYYLKNDKTAFDIEYYKPVAGTMNKNSVLISIGGDNYCYGENEYIYLLNRYARKKDAKTVLWGCSVNPDTISKKMEDDLSQYNYIFARESITYERLKRINKNTFLYPDSAFTLPIEKGIWPQGLGNKPFVGINISPMIRNNETVEGMTIANYCKVIDYILENTEYDIALIPHVVWSSNDDRTTIEVLRSNYENNDRLFVVKDQNCMQLKDIISKCEVFIGARTHATIAAYSTCVPTLVIGYSVKARGIAKDLFSSENHFVCPVQDLKTEEDLLKDFLWIFEKRKEIRKHLVNIMPEYISLAHKAGEELRRLLKNESVNNY